MTDNTEKMTEEKAGELMDQGFHCSQCVFSYAAQRMGMDKSLALKLSAGLGGGCYHGDSCGAITAAALAIGMAYGFDQPNATQEDQVLISNVKAMEARFQQENGALLCRHLLQGFDKADPAAVAPEGTYSQCPQFCATACNILDELLGEHYVK